MLRRSHSDAGAASITTATNAVARAAAAAQDLQAAVFGTTAETTFTAAGENAAAVRTSE